MRDTLGRYIKGFVSPWRDKDRLQYAKEGNPNWRGGKPSCIDCGKDINYTRKRCQPCYLKTLKGPGNPNWKNGITDPVFSIRSTKRYKQWRSDILVRDNWTCQTCQKRGCDLEVHHTKDLVDIINNPKELWNLDNGVTLCSKCHELTKRKNNKGIYQSAAAAQPAKGAPGAQ